MSLTLYVAAYTLGSKAAAMAKERILSNRCPNEPKESAKLKLSPQPCNPLYAQRHIGLAHPRRDVGVSLILTSMRALYTGAMQNFQDTMG